MRGQNISRIRNIERTAAANTSIKLLSQHIIIAGIKTTGQT
jgi:hypothetical protein